MVGCSYGSCSSAHLDHVLLGDPLGDAHHQWHLGLDGLHGGRRRHWWWHEHHRCSRASLRFSLSVQSHAAYHSGSVRPICMPSAAPIAHGRTNQGCTSPTSATDANTGNPRCSSPAFLGLVPPTICVPYAIACSLWKVPCNNSNRRVVRFCTDSCSRRRSPQPGGAPRRSTDATAGLTGGAGFGTRAAAQATDRDGCGALEVELWSSLRLAQRTGITQHKSNKHTPARP